MYLIKWVNYLRGRNLTENSYIFNKTINGIQPLAVSTVYFLLKKKNSAQNISHLKI